MIASTTNAMDIINNLLKTISYETVDIFFISYLDVIN